MKTHRTISLSVNSFLVIFVLFLFDTTNTKTFAQSTSIPDDPTAVKSHQMISQGEKAPTLQNDNLSITGIANSGFENGNVDWVEYSSGGYNIIMNSGLPGITPHSGSWIAWLGGAINETSYIQQQITVPVDDTAMTYWHWIASADMCGYDKAQINVNSVAVAEYDLCDTNNTGGWVEATVDLSVYAGQSVTLQIRVENDDTFSSNYFVDDFSWGLTQVYLPILINR